MTAEEPTMEQALADLTTLGVQAEARERQNPSLRDARLGSRPPLATNFGLPKTGKPAQPMDLLYQSATSARETLEQVQMFADFMLGIGNLPGETETKPPMGIMPTVAFHADTISHCMAEIRKLIEQMRAAA
jgi:hypothetical protein